MRPKDDSEHGWRKAIWAGSGLPEDNSPTSCVVELIDLRLSAPVEAPYPSFYTQGGWVYIVTFKSVTTRILSGLYLYLPILQISIINAVGLILGNTASPFPSQVPWSPGLRLYPSSDGPPSSSSGSPPGGTLGLHPSQQPSSVRQNSRCPLLKVEQDNLLEYSWVCKN